jgi:hypothetical protein
VRKLGVLQTRLCCCALASERSRSAKSRKNVDDNNEADRAEGVGASSSSSSDSTSPGHSSVDVAAAGDGEGGAEAVVQDACFVERTDDGVGDGGVTNEVAGIDGDVHDAKTGVLLLGVGISIDEGDGPGDGGVEDDGGAMGGTGNGDTDSAGVESTTSSARSGASKVCAAVAKRTVW